MRNEREHGQDQARQPPLGSNANSALSISVHGHAIPPSESLRWLGITLDSRLNFNEHWATLSSACKRSTGALSRLCHHNATATSHFCRERVQSVLLHSLLYTPPSTATAWRQLNNVATYTARLATNR